MPSERTIKSIRSTAGHLHGNPDVYEVHGADGPLHRYPCGCDWWSGSDRWRLCQYHDGFDEAAEQADELQALIDAYAAADRKLFHFVAEVYYEREQALSALLAAATKEDDRD